MMRSQAQVTELVHYFIMHFNTIHIFHFSPQLMAQQARFLETRARLLEAGVEEEQNQSPCPPTIKQEPDTSGDNVYPTHHQTSVGDGSPIREGPLDLSMCRKQS